MAKADSRNVLADLKAHLKKGAPDDMRRAFERDPKRFAEFSAKSDDLLLDYSKCAVNARTMKLLSQLAKAADVEAKRDAMFKGAIINSTEQRAVLHTALRNRANTPVMVAGQDVMPDVNAVLAAMSAFAKPGAPLEDHRRRQHRHRRLRPRPRHDHAGAGALSRRPAPPLRLQRRRRTHRRHAEGAQARDDAVPHRVQDLHHHRDHDQREDRAGAGSPMRWARRRWARTSPPSPPPSTR